MSKCPKFWRKVLLQTLWQIHLLGNGDRPIAKLGETLTGVSINKPLIRKKEAKQSSNSTGGEYQWHAHICMHTGLSGKHLSLTGGFTSGTTDSPWQWACPLFDCAVNPAHPLPSKAALVFFFSTQPPSPLSNQLICAVPWVCRCVQCLHRDWLWWGSSTPSVRQKMEEGKQGRVRG